VGTEHESEPVRGVLGAALRLRKTRVLLTAVAVVAALVVAGLALHG
jgi:hypothetical protein